MPSSSSSPSSSSATTTTTTTTAPPNIPTFDGLAPALHKTIATFLSCRSRLIAGSIQRTGTEPSSSYAAEVQELLIKLPYNTLELLLKTLNEDTAIDRPSQLRELSGLLRRVPNIGCLRHYRSQPELVCLLREVTFHHPCPRLQAIRHCNAYGSDSLGGCIEALDGDRYGSVFLACALDKGHLPAWNRLVLTPTFPGKAAVGILCAVLARGGLPNLEAIEVDACAGGPDEEKIPLSQIVDAIRQGPALHLRELSFKYSVSPEIAMDWTEVRLFLCGSNSANNSANFPPLAENVDHLSFKCSIMNSFDVEIPPGLGPILAQYLKGNNVGEDEDGGGRPFLQHLTLACLPHTDRGLVFETLSKKVAPNLKGLTFTSGMVQEVAETGTLFSEGAFPKVESLEFNQVQLTKDNVASLVDGIHKGGASGTVRRLVFNHVEVACPRLDPTGEMPALMFTKGLREGKLAALEELTVTSGQFLCGEKEVDWLLDALQKAPCAKTLKKVYLTDMIRHQLGVLKELLPNAIVQTNKVEERQRYEDDGDY